LPRLKSVRFCADVPPPPALSDLSRAELEGLLVELFGRVGALEKVVAEQARRDRPSEGPERAPDHQTERHGKGAEPAMPAKQEKPRRRGKVTPRVNIEDRIVKAAAVPEGSRFKGHEPFLVRTW
jgi:hypothetical protein